MMSVYSWPGAGPDPSHLITPDPPLCPTMWPAGELPATAPVNLTSVTGRPLHAFLLPPDRTGRLIEALATALDGSGPAILPLDPGLPPARVTALCEAFAPAVVVATSGSTGQPKGAQLSAAALLHSARASLGRIGARPGERWLCPLPTSHIAGLGVLVRSLVSGTDPVVT